MALVYLDADPWLTEHEACEKLYREIMEQLTLRSREQKTSQAYARISSSIRLRLKQYSSEVQQVKDKLSEATASHAIGLEAERRFRQVERLQSIEVQLQQQFNDRNLMHGADRQKLMNKSTAVFADVGTTGWGLDGDSEEAGAYRTEHTSVADLQQQQQRMIQDQDQGLEALSKVISRQKEIAETIGTEVDLQNDIIDDLADQMDRTDSRVRNETRSVTVIDRKDRTCWYWVVIILLFISILLAAFV